MAGQTRTGTPFFYEFKKQASFFLREKIKNARLAFTDVTPAEILAEEVTNGNPWAPDAKTMGFISRAAFEIDDFWRIVNVLHKRLSKVDFKHWRESYNAIVLLEHLLTHGPESVGEEFLCDREVIQKLGNFQNIDERGFNWGLAVRKKSERVLKLLEKGPLLKEERDRARKVTRGIQGFGSLNYRWSEGIKNDGFEYSSDNFGRCNSHYESCNQKDDAISEILNQNFNSDAETSDLKNINFIDERSMKNNVVNIVYEKLLDKEEANQDDKEQSKRFSKNGLEKLLSDEHMEKPKIELQTEEHPFVLNEHHRFETLLLLSQS